MQERENLIQEKDFKELFFNKDEWLTPNDLVEIFGITKSAQSHYRLKKNYTPEAATKNKPLPYYRVANKILYKKSEFILWMKTKKNREYK